MTKRIQSVHSNLCTSQDLLFAEALEDLASLSSTRLGHSASAPLLAQAYRLRRCGDDQEWASTLFCLIWHLVLSGNSGRALRLYMREMDALQSAGFAQEGFELLAELGEELFHLHRFDEAKRVFLVALPLAPHRYPYWGRARILEALAVAHEQTGDHTAAIKSSHEAAIALDSLGFAVEAGNLKVREARLRIHLQDFYEANRLLRGSLELFQEHNQARCAVEALDLLRVLSQVPHYSSGDAGSLL